jgi:hypothetical protein
MNFSLDFFGTQFDHKKMNLGMKIFLINDRDSWWWLSPDRGVRSPLF